MFGIMKVKNIMSTDVISVDKDINLREVLKLMKKHDITKIPVLEKKKLVGVVTDNIIAYKLGSIRKKGVPASRLHASSVTEKDFVKISPDTEVKSILKKVGEPGPTMLNVVEDDNLLGVVTKADLLPLVKSKKQLKDIMQKEIFTVSSDDRVIHARRIMIDEEVARLPVLYDGKLVGIISDTEIAFALAELKRSFSLGHQKHRLEKLLVGDAMKSPAIWTLPTITAAEAAKIMYNKNIGFLPLIQNDKLVGVVTRTDLLQTINL